MKSNQTITVNDKMQTGYKYVLSAGVGEDFSKDFNPYYSPSEMLSMGTVSYTHLTLPTTPYV